VGVPYQVVGGIGTCCGIPQLVQGELELAEQCLDDLHGKIMVSAPEIIVTGCAECLEALLRIKAKFGEDYRVLSVTEYLMMHIDRFPDLKVRGKVTLHDSCRIARRYRRGDAARLAINRFAELEEVERNRDSTMCCYHWNHDHDPGNLKHRVDRFTEAKKAAPVMACDCLTCLEEFEKVEYDRKGLELIDVVQLFEEAMDAGAAVASDAAADGKTAGNGKLEGGQ
jgi:Fe-S oxidoreductase